MGKNFPDWLYVRLGIPQRLAEGMALHFFFMWLFIANGVAYVMYLAFTGEWRKVLPDRGSLRDAILVTLHDLHLRRDTPPQGLYDGAQRIAYTAVIAMAMGSVVTGLAIYKPAQLSWLTGLLGGYPTARWEQFWLMAGFVSFFMVHVAQVIRAGWDNFRSMVRSEEAPIEVGYRRCRLTDAQPANSPELNKPARTTIGCVLLVRHDPLQGKPASNFPGWLREPVLNPRRHPPNRTKPKLFPQGGARRIFEVT